MKKKLVPIILMMIVLWGLSAHAGGSWEAVHVFRFEQKNETDYILVLDVINNHKTPLEKQDPAFGGCKHLEVHGTFRSLREKGRLAWLTVPHKYENITKTGHLKAVQFLKDSYLKHLVINFGYIGTGFVPLDSTNNCVVMSRALELYKDNNSTAVISYHDAF
jgi:hypothetical protein